MAISEKLEDYLNLHQTSYDLIPHPHTGSSMETAQEAHVPGNRLAKAVIIRDGEDYLMVVLPSVDHVDLTILRQHFGHAVELATEVELGKLFPDCEVGAVPPIGSAWGLNTYLDQSLLDEPEMFFEAGNHEDLVRVNGDDFDALLKNAKRGYYSRAV